ncbi:MAG: TolC family protein [Planctomycetaceae bacterium]|nr:TolC family protein [Planctomycetaceae bacterium]
MDSHQSQNQLKKWAVSVALLGSLVPFGCQTNRSSLAKVSVEPRETISKPANRIKSPILQTAFQEDSDSDESDPIPAPLETEVEKELSDSVDATVTPLPPPVDNELPSLEATALGANPNLIKLQQQAQAAFAKARYQDALPDPTIGANIFGLPIETAAGSQQANLSIMQMIPWLDRLDAQRQQACYEAMSQDQQYQAEALRVVGDIRASYYRLYILHRQIETIQANQELLESLIEIANSRIATGQATQGDVLLGTLELSRLEEQLITLRQQIRSTEAQINRLLNRPVDIAINVPAELDVPEPNWTHNFLVSMAFQRQPMIAMAQLQANAARWGVEVAELRRKPDFQVGASWFFIDGNRPNSNIVDVGQDAFSVGATMTIPLDRQKYDAIRDEALWRHAASTSNIADVQKAFDARLLDLLEQARSANDTASLYRSTIIPQSEQTLRADQEALINGTVEFDRVIQDFRNLLTLEFEYHRSIGNLAIAIARIRQAVGVDVVVEKGREIDNLEKPQSIPPSIEGAEFPSLPEPLLPR